MPNLYKGQYDVLLVSDVKKGCKNKLQDKRFCLSREDSYYRNKKQVQPTYTEYKLLN